MLETLETIEIETIIPQRKPFVMIDTLTHFDQVVTQTKLKVSTNNIFVKDNKFSECGIMENIAQTCAARMGYINKKLNSDKVKIGFIGSINNLIIEKLPKVGDEISTTIEVINEVFTIVLVKAKVEINKAEIASCEMKISLTEMDSQ